MSGANALLRGDRLGYFATDGEVERVGTTCEGDSCAFGLVFRSRMSDFSIENAELELLRERRAVAFLSKASRT